MAEDDPVGRLWREVFGERDAPERGLKTKHDNLEKDVRPIVRFFNSAKWPLVIVVTGLLAAAGGYIFNLVKMIGGSP